MIGIIGAMPSEVDALRREMTDVTERKVGFSTIWEGTLCGKKTALALCGIGKVHAALCAQAMLLRYPLKLLLNIGGAGALIGEAAIADAVVADAAVQHDMDTSPLGDPRGMISGINLVELPCDRDAAGRLRAAAERCGIRCFSGNIATGDRFIERVEEKKELHTLFHASACDMEGAAIAQTAYEMGVPYAAYRCISDTLYGDGNEYAVNAGRACEAGAKLLRAFLADMPEA